MTVAATWPVTVTAQAVRIAAAVCAVAFGTFCLLTLMQVINRYLIGGELYWTEEVVILLSVWSVMTGLPVALWSRNEIVVDLLDLKPGRLKTLQLGLAELASVVFLIAMTWSGLDLIERAGDALSPALELPRWLFYASIPVGTALSVLVVVGRVWRDSTATVTDKDTKYVADSHD